MRIAQTITIAASADRVWDLIGHGFTDMGSWASAVTSSTASASGDGRVCEVDGLGAVGPIVEKLTSYDDQQRELTYEVEAGRPAFVASARNTWRVDHLTAGGARVAISAEVELRGLARLATPVTAVGLRLLGGRTLRELRYLVEHGVPAPRKRRRLATHDEQRDPRPPGTGDGGRLRRIRSSVATATSPIAFEAERWIDAPTDRVWRSVADAGDYARFARGIAATEIVSGEGHGMVRVCTDEHGGRWAEHCTLWDEGRTYRMSVEVATYPAYYRLLLHELAQTWQVEPEDGGTRLHLSFDGAVKLGPLGIVAARLLGNRRRLTSILDAYERELGLQQRQR